MCSMCCAIMIAQPPTYKGVTIDRDRDDNTCIVAKNSNSYPVEIRMQYKVGSRDTEWRDYSTGKVRIEANSTKRFYVSSKIYGLNLIYVDILQPSVIGQVFEALVGTDGNGTSTKTSTTTNTNSSSENSGLNCYKCGGSGTYNGQTCPECNGTGKQTKPVPFPEPEKRY